jgi:hypothetical protein
MYCNLMPLIIFALNADFILTAVKQNGPQAWISDFIDIVTIKLEVADTAI